MLRSSELAELIEGKALAAKNRLSIVPTPNLKTMRASGTASIDLRLGRWFRTIRPSRVVSIAITRKPENENIETKYTKEHFVRFGGSFVLHPRAFLLGITLEWISLPLNVAGYVTGKSSWGRRGLVIETAAGIHPGFSGCLTLEMSNLGEVPICLEPGMEICQIFLHKVSDGDGAAQTQFVGRRKPLLGDIEEDAVLGKLRADL